MKKLFPLILIALLFLVLEFPVSKEASLKAQQRDASSLSFWHIADPEEVFQPLFNAWKKDHPANTISYQQFADEEELRGLLLEQLKKGKGPDVFTFPLRDFQDFLPYLLPTSLKGDEKLWTFARDRLVQKKSLYGLPLSAEALMAIYHDRYYPQGLKVGWNDFAQQTRAVSIPGIAMGVLSNVKSGWDMLETLFVQKGVVLSGKPKNAWFDILEFFTRFSDEKDPNFNWNERLSKHFAEMELQSFVQGQVAAVFGYPEDYWRVLEKIQTEDVRIPKEVVSLGFLPQFDSKNPRYLGQSMVLGVSLSSRSPKVAWEFVRFLTNEDNAKTYESLTGKISGRPIPWTKGDSELARIQKTELASASSFILSEKAKKRVESILDKVAKEKNKEELREILNEAL